MAKKPTTTGLVALECGADGFFAERVRQQVDDEGIPW